MATLCIYVTPILYLHIYVDCDGELEDVNLDDVYCGDHMDSIVDQRSDSQDRKGQM